MRKHKFTKKQELSKKMSSPRKSPCKDMSPRKKMKTEEKRRSMTLPEKILTNWAVGLKKPEVEPGQMLCVKAQWTLACEITWKSMDKTYQVC
jgi:hypothetical protein